MCDHSCSALPSVANIAKKISLRSHGRVLRVCWRIAYGRSDTSLALWCVSFASVRAARYGRSARMSCVSVSSVVRSRAVTVVAGLRAS